MITGASSGIGEELFKEVMRRGAQKVIIAARSTDKLETLKKECPHPERVQVFTLDLSKPYECFERAKSLKLDRLDYLINNGGVSMR